MSVSVACRRLVAVVCLALLGMPAHALALYGADDKANTGNPGNGSPWQAVGTFTNRSGAGIGESCVYLGHGYVLTANHVGVSDWVLLDGLTYARDTAFVPVQIAPGADAKVLRLASVPSGLQGAALYGGTGEHHAPVTQIGYGVGRNPADAHFGPGPITVHWGGGRGKRWGTNTVGALLPKQNVAGYVYDALGVMLDATGDTNEAGCTDGDSGSAMFALLDGQWQLIGLNTGVSTPGACVFGGPAPDTNVAVRISSYRRNILVLIPEPARFDLLTAGSLLTIAVLLAASGGWLMLRRPGRRQKPRQGR